MSKKRKRFETSLPGILYFEATLDLRQDQLIITTWSFQDRHSNIPVLLFPDRRGQEGLRFLKISHPILNRSTGKHTDYGEDIDHKIDLALREKLSNPEMHVAVESWIAGWNMRGLKHVLKVLLICDDALRIDRIVNRDNLSVEKAKTHLKEREEANLEKWSKMYHVPTTDFWDVKYYDLVINTYSHGPQETLNLVLQALGYFSANGQKKQKP
ncbi:MAG: hypothetical protein UW22_C0057G0002 [Candidatus Gottesmanbacteria bacterium GW2011_GWB1_44_11c]|uniref:Cytidylate kinase n=1 Tax=Candidatus Gottesmanbacteria bacterium GW2011_GWB1_44_11c TaxID=1618447 RepID=A0A0G1GKZ0_9BACT|nr:MAG: hypothetical protein UW22_C0057G0002 [Candidatus Gottesmanbacteria bacterium GW2011_GWB1_44_11c]